RDRRQRSVGRPLAEDRPREHADEDDLEVAEHRREPGAYLLDALVPGDEVDREEEPGEPGERALAQRPGAVAPVLEPGQRPEHGQRVEAAEDGAGRRRDVRDPKED